MSSESNKHEELEQIELPPFPPANWWDRNYRKVEAKFSKLSLKSKFWYLTLRFIYFPLGSKSGMPIGKWVDGPTGEVYEAILPFKKFNKNWYNAMAGAAILANTEIAGGMAIFELVGEQYTIVCKDLSYKFRLPCHSAATYRVKILNDIHTLMKTQPEFNIDMQIEVFSELKNKMRKIGTSTVTFHVAAKSLMAQRIYKQKQRANG